MFFSFSDSTCSFSSHVFSSTFTEIPPIILHLAHISALFASAHSFLNGCTIISMICASPSSILLWRPSIPGYFHSHVFLDSVGSQIRFFQHLLLLFFTFLLFPLYFAFDLYFFSLAAFAFHHCHSLYHVQATLTGSKPGRFAKRGVWGLLSCPFAGERGSFGFGRFKLFLHISHFKL